MLKREDRQTERERKNEIHSYAWKEKYVCNNNDKDVFFLLISQCLVFILFAPSLSIHYLDDR